MHLYSDFYFIFLLYYIFTIDVRMCSYFQHLFETFLYIASLSGDTYHQSFCKNSLWNKSSETKILQTHIFPLLNLYTRSNFFAYFITNSFLCSSVSSFSKSLYWKLNNFVDHPWLYGIFIILPQYSWFLQTSRYFNTTAGRVG